MGFDYAAILNQTFGQKTDGKSTRVSKPQTSNPRKGGREKKDEKPRRQKDKAQSKGGKAKDRKSNPERKTTELSPEVREGKKPGVYVHIIRLLMKASKSAPLTDEKCYEALSRVKALKERFASQEGKDGIWITMKDAYRRTLMTRMGWPVQTDGKGGFWMKGGEKAKSSNDFQQAKWERLNSAAK